MVNFLKFTKLYFLISAFVIGLGLISILVWGFRFSIDFVGGTNLEYKLNKNVTLADLKKEFSKNNLEVVSLKKVGEIMTARTKAINEKEEAVFISGMKKDLKTELVVLRSETVGPVLGRETMVKTLIASGLALLGILIYMSYAFKSLNFATSAILAMVHDFLVVIGSYSLMSHFLGAELDTLFVTAILTAMSFSVHDTIVIFDKIREYKRSHGISDFEHSTNRALTETLVRSMNNSMTIIFMLLALTLLGGSTIRFFVATLLVGTITGTYSSPFIATPILVWLEKRKK